MYVKSQRANTDIYCTLSECTSTIFVDLFIVYRIPEPCIIIERVAL
jgi:hypothetical protein